MVLMVTVERRVERVPEPLTPWFHSGLLWDALSRSGCRQVGKGKLTREYMVVTPCSAGAAEVAAA